MPIVKVQRMFPNCDKYKKCCPDSGMEELMDKVKKIHNFGAVSYTHLTLPTNREV